MKDFIQESEVNEVLNKRHEYFTPKLGSFYGVEVGCGKEIEYATLTSIDYAHDFPYLCNVIVCKAIAINGDVKVPAKLAERRFDYSGVSEDGKSTLLNLSDEEKVNAKKDLDIDFLNWRSPKNVLEWVVLTDDVKPCLVIPSYLLCLFALCSTVFSFASKLNIVSISSWVILFAVALYMHVTEFTHIAENTKPIRSIVLQICAFATIFLNTYNIVNILETDKVSWIHLMPALVSLFILFTLMCFYFYVNPGLSLNKARQNVFMVGSFNRFVTKSGRLAVITTKFGDDSDFPMEGYVVTHPEIRNGDVVVKERVSLAVKWSYSGRPAKCGKDDGEFDNYTLCNTPEDAKAVLDLFDKQYGVKTESGAERATEKAGTRRRYV